MTNKKDNSHSQILEIKEMLCAMHNDLKRFMEQSGQQHLESILAGSRTNFTNAIIGHVVEDIEEGLESNMVKKCEMRDICKSNFSGFLQKNAGLIARDNVREHTILKKQSELNKMRSNAPAKQCEKCFSEVQSIFGKQVGLLRSLRIYDTNGDKKQDIHALPEEFIVNDIIEPLSSKQRFQILKAVSTETKTFSALSELTGLRGGNLLFHLQKLLDSSVILQRHERGDYMITEKGYKILTGMRDIYSSLEDLEHSR